MNYEQFIPQNSDSFVTSDGNTFFVLGEGEKGFYIECYQNTAENNRVDKTNRLVLTNTLKGTLRKSTSIVAPIIDIELNGVPQFNYVYIPSFRRYYFVTDIVSVKQRLWTITLKCDVLMTYRDGIKELNAYVTRNENSNNPLIVDRKRMFEQGYDYEITELPNEAFTKWQESAEHEENPHLCFVLNGFALKLEGEAN